MRPIFIISLTAVLCGSSAYAQKKDETPAAVKAVFAKKFPTAKDVKWEKEDGKYEASFKDNGKETSILYSATGAVEETETSISLADLPPRARKYAQGKGTIKEASKIVLASGAVHYEAEVKGKDLIFDEEGNFLNEKTEKPDDKN